MSSVSSITSFSIGGCFETCLPRLRQERTHGKRARAVLISNYMPIRPAPPARHCDEALGTVHLGDAARVENCAVQRARAPLLTAAEGGCGASRVCRKPLGATTLPGQRGASCAAFATTTSAERRCGVLVEEEVVLVESSC